MRVDVRSFASLREIATDRCELTLDDGATVADAWARMADRYRGLEPHRPYVRTARNGRYAAWDELLADGDTIALLPPVSGGATTALVAGPIDGGMAWLTWLRLGVGILLPIGITVLAILASRAASLQASTGLLYVGLALIMAGSIAGASISYLTGVPV